VALRPSQGPSAAEGDGGWESVSQVERYAHLVPSNLIPQIRSFRGRDLVAVAKCDERRHVTRLKLLVEDGAELVQ